MEHWNPPPIKAAHRAAKRSRRNASPPVRSTIVVTAPPDVKQQRIVARLRKWLSVASSDDRIKRILGRIEKIGGVDARIEAEDAVPGGR